MKNPPKFLLRLLNLFCPPSRQDLKGDFLELYEQRVEQLGRGRADWKFLLDTLTVLPLRLLVKEKLTYRSSIPMFSHYVKVAFRNLSRSKAYSIINILGLAVGMGVCLLIYQYISFELSYDRFHQNAENVYRVTQADVRDGAELTRNSYTTYALGPLAKERIPEMEEAVRVHRQYEGLIMINLENNERHQEDEMWYVDSGFLQMFNFPLKYGDRATALNDPKSIVLSEAMANLYFGGENPMGKTLRVSGGTLSGEYIVRGVLEPLPLNSHLQFDFLLPMQFLLEHWRLYTISSGWEWKNFVTYVRLSETAELARVRQKFDQIVKTGAGGGLAASGLEWRIFLQPLTDIHLRSDFQRDIAKNNGDIRTVRYFAIVGAIILVMAWVNYINLSTAQALRRAREVGIRKSVGAHQSQLISQFLTESFLINLLAILLSFGIALLLLPALNEIAGKALTFSLFREAGFWLWLAAVLLSGSLISGLYPAFVLSSFKPQKVLKSSLSFSSKGFGLRKSLIVFQFLISIILISATWLFQRQISFMQNQDLGMDIEKIVAINGPRVILETLKEEGETLDSKYSTFRNQALNHHSVSSISAASNLPGTGYIWSGEMRKLGLGAGDVALTHAIFVDTTFFNAYGAEFVAGGIPEGETGQYDWLVLNEEAVKKLGFESPEEAIKDELDLIGDTIKVAGVVKNIHWSSLQEPYVPMAFLLDNQYGAYLSVKVGLSNIQETIEHLEKSFHSAFPNDPFYYFFLDDSFNRQYQADLQFGNLFTAFSALAIFISCLGLFALVSFSASLKTKEIGIRKVLGASVGQLMALLSKEYLYLLFIACVLAAPLVVWGGQQWLENYAFRIKMGVEFIIVPVIVLLIISLLTVSYKTWTAARSNPVKSLRTE